MFLQLIKFLTVGSFNMLTDFAIFNLLLLLFLPTGVAALFVTSLTSSLIATVVSYFLNFYWTFRPEGEARHWKRFKRFVLFALFAILVSQSIFLFMIHVLKPFFPPESLLLPNLAKLIGVMIAAFVNFINYRMGVFHGEDQKQFRKTFNFNHPNEKNLWLLCGITVIIALISRLVFLFLTTAIDGDASHYANLAFSLVNGKSDLPNLLWVNLFVFWEVFIYLFIKDPTVGAIVATIIPGTLMMIPIFWMGKILFNGQIGFFAALITALHPRLIAFSCNGYPEIFYIFFVSLGVLCLTIFLKNRSIPNETRVRYTFLWLTCAFGICLALYVAVRLEGILLYFAMLSTLLFIPRRFPYIVSSVLGFSLTLGLYLTLTSSLIGNPDLSEKKMNFVKNSSKEAHENNEPVNKDEGHINLSETINNLLKSYPINILYTMEKFPGVVLTPLIFSAFLLPMVWRPKNLNLLPFTPLLLMFIFPLAFYPFIVVESRYFFMCLIPIHILGFAGLFAFLHYVQPRYTLALFRGITLLIIFYLIPITIWYGLSRT